MQGHLAVFNAPVLRATVGFPMPWPLPLAAPWTLQWEQWNPPPSALLLPPGQLVECSMISHQDFTTGKSADGNEGTDGCEGGESALVNLP